jgi:hypothetical protein
MIKQKQHTDAFEMMGQKQPAKDEISVIWLGDGVARMDQADTSSWIINTESNVIYALNHNKKTYSEISIGGSGEATGMPGMEGMMEDMDPEEAEKMSEMMGGMMSSMMKIKLKVTPTGEEKKIKNWTCKRYIVNTEMGAGVTSTETWATEDIELDYELFNAVSRAFMSMMPGYEDALKEMKKVKGLTIFSEGTTQMMGARVKTTTEVLEYKEESAPKGIFEIPKGYKKIED